MYQSLLLSINTIIYCTIFIGITNTTSTTTTRKCVDPGSSLATWTKRLLPPPAHGSCLLRHNLHLSCWTQLLLQSLSGSFASLIILTMKKISGEQQRLHNLVPPRDPPANLHWHDWEHSHHPCHFY